MAYIKQTWDTTSYVNPTRMNHIEEGIESISNWKFLGSFALTGGATGDWNLINNVPDNCSDLLFYLTIGTGAVGNKPRMSLLIPYNVFANEVALDYYYQSNRFFTNIAQDSNTPKSKFVITGTTLGSVTSVVTLVCYAR